MSASDYFSEPKSKEFLLRRRVEVLEQIDELQAELLNISIGLDQFAPAWPSSTVIQIVMPPSHQDDRWRV